MDRMTLNRISRCSCRTAIVVAFGVLLPVMAEATEERYANGVGTILDLLDAQVSMTRAEAKVVEATLSHQSAYSRFPLVTGSFSGRRTPSRIDVRQCDIVFIG